MQITDIIKGLKEQINLIEQSISTQKEWNTRLTKDDTFTSIVEYRNQPDAVSIEQNELDECCLKYFETLTDLKDVIYDNCAIAENYTEDIHTGNTHLELNEQEIMQGEESEEIQIESDEDFIKTAELEENI